MQIHPVSFRNHNAQVFERFGRDKGADIPCCAEFIANLEPLLDCLGNDPNPSIILFILHESSYARELAPLAGRYPYCQLGQT